MQSVQETSGSVTLSMFSRRDRSLSKFKLNLRMNSVALTGSGRNLAVAAILALISRSLFSLAGCLWRARSSWTHLRTRNWCFCTSMNALDAFSSIVPKSR